ncbi:MAG: radical SAM protein [Planctomycetota bacterium]
MADRAYTFLELTNSLCATCLRKVEAKIIAEGDRVILSKWCPEHGREKVLVADDLEWWHATRRAVRPGQIPKRFNTAIERGCPFDCGLCPDHEQHSCLTLVEVTDHCNLSCPICYAASGPHRPGYRSLETIEAMLDAIVANEGEPDVVQISGGEPTLHPQLFEILEAAKRRPIRHLMLNTNGIRIAEEDGFAERLAELAPGFEIYLQFDSLREEPLKRLRGVDLRDVRAKALERLNALNLSTTLVSVVQRGLNEDELGEQIDFALAQRCVRGLTLQPVQVAGRHVGFDPARDRLTVSEVRRRVIEQSRHFRGEDIVPVPCHPECIAMAYALKTKDGPVPLTGLLGEEALQPLTSNTIAFEKHRDLEEHLLGLFRTSHSPESAGGSLAQLLCCLPKFEARGFGYEDVFRLIVMQFLDAHSMDMRSVKRTCVHIAHSDGRIIPFDTYNLMYREDEGVMR